MPHVVVFKKNNWKIENIIIKENYLIKCGTHHIQTVSKYLRETF